MRYFLKLSYNGTRFHGWQSQPNAVSVQRNIEEALSIVTRLPINIVGAGRTDAGVHAREMFAHFDVPFAVPDKSRFLNSINRLVGKDVAFDDLIEVSDEAHARFDAIERTYKYFITYNKSPFVYDYSCFMPHELNVDAMNEAAKILLTTSDFTSFAKLHSDAKTNLCEVREAHWNKSGEDFPFMPNGLVFTISANRFLRNMVRAVVGTLVEVGRGRVTTDGFRDIILSKNRSSAGMSMPAEGLFLWEIKYPYIK
ncbi:MAG: tRNA pseudouridine(38-40) synthase TruA [Muribaculaceae bacterium]|nr:tRNA pseudouridine(38-40) synthase TruA [Muribaculaceae bacterium]